MSTQDQNKQYRNRIHKLEAIKEQLMQEKQEQEETIQNLKNEITDLKRDLMKLTEDPY